MERIKDFALTKMMRVCSRFPLTEQVESSAFQTGGVTRCSGSTPETVMPRIIHVLKRLVLMVVGFACLIDPASAADQPKRLKVVASFLPAYCFAANISGGLADVENLLPSGVNPHEFQLSSRDLKRLEQADLLIVNGLKLEEWLMKVISRLPARKRPRVVECSAGMEDMLIYSRSGASHSGHGHAHGHGPGHEEGKQSKQPRKAGKEDRDANPHVWLDPRLAMRAVSNITEAIVTLDGGRSVQYRAHRDAYIVKLTKLDEDLLAGLKAVRSRSFVTLHDAFPYFVRRYDLKLTGVLEEVPEVSPSPRVLSDLIKRMRDEKSVAIFTEPGNTPGVARQLGRDMKLPVIELDTLETGPVAPDSYEIGMRRNLDVMARHLR